MLRVILNRPKTQAEEIIAEKQAGFRAGRTPQNRSLTSESFVKSTFSISRIFTMSIDFEKAYNRVWYAGLSATMWKYNISANLVCAFEHLYGNTISAAQMNGSTGECFKTTVGVRQGCLLSPTLFNIFL